MEMKSLMFSSLRGTSPPSPPKTPAREARVRVLPTPDSAPAGSGAAAMQLCTASAQDNRQSASRLLLLPFAEKGGGSGTKRGKK